MPWMFPVQVSGYDEVTAIHTQKMYFSVHLLTSYLTSGALWWYRCYIKVAAIHQHVHARNPILQDE